MPDATPDPAAPDAPASGVLSVPIALRWSDMDAYRHVNNVQFLRLLEESRIVALGEWLGLGDGDTAGLLVARNEIEYLAQLDYRRAPIVVDLWVSDLGCASFVLGYEVRDGDERPGRTVYARAETTLVGFDFATGRPRRIPDDMRATLLTHHGPPVALRRRVRAAHEGQGR